MSSKLIIPLGTAASGKTTWYESYNFNNPCGKDYVQRISADDTRFHLLNYPDSGIDFDPKVEPEVWRMVWFEFIRVLRGSYSIYLDCTNLTKARRQPFIDCARAFGYEIQLIWFQTSLATCLQQNADRDRTLDEAIIARQFVALQAPEGYEYDTLIEVA